MIRDIYQVVVFVVIAIIAIPIVSASASVSGFAEDTQRIEVSADPIADPIFSVPQLLGRYGRYDHSDLDDLQDMCLGGPFDIDKNGYTNEFKWKIVDTKQVIEKNGLYYQERPFDFVRNFDSYFSIKQNYLLEHPGSCVVINLAGYGWFSNNVIVERSYDDRLVYDANGNEIDYPGEYLVDVSDDHKRSIYIHQKVVDYLYGDIKWRDLKWYGTKSPQDGWTDVVWGKMYISE